VEKKPSLSTTLFSTPSSISGIARFLDWGATFDSYNDSESGEQADADAVLADWTAVGNDLRKSAAIQLEENCSSKKAA
jgi:hypothetical protein